MRMRIDVFSDVVCPWCWVGKRRLARALEQRPDVEADRVRTKLADEAVSSSAGAR